jgi:sulfatase maturation enzyme AslB (radical SAM superfamily)
MPPAKYSLSPDVILREEPQYYSSYSAFNYKTVTSITLDEAEAKALRYIQTKAASAEEISKNSGLTPKVCEEFLRQMYKHGFVQINKAPPAATMLLQVDTEAYRSFPVPFLSAPAQIDFFITSKCNLHCTHCFAEVKTHQATDYPIDELQTAFAMLERLGVLEVRISGGEPLMHAAILPALELLGKAKFRKILLTNGTLLTAEITRALKAAGVTPTVSLDDSDATAHDSFRGTRGAHKRTIDGLKLLQKGGVEYGINCCLNKKNLNRIQDIIDLAAEYGASRIAFLDLKPIGRMRNNTDWLPATANTRLL